MSCGSSRGPEIIRGRQQCDVCIVGSGAGGGMSAKVLAEAGAQVVMLEAGGAWDAASDAAMLRWPYESPRRGAATPERQFGEFNAGLGGWSLDGEPYTVADGDAFDWFRVRMLGGRTNHWGRISRRPASGPARWASKTSSTWATSTSHAGAGARRNNYASSG